MKPAPRQLPVVWLEDIDAWLNDASLVGPDRRNLEGLRRGMTTAGLAALTLTSVYAYHWGYALDAVDAGHLPVDPAVRSERLRELTLEGAHLDDCPAFEARRAALTSNAAQALDCFELDGDAPISTGRYLRGCLDGYNETWHGDAHRASDDPARPLTWVERQTAADITERMIDLNDPPLDAWARRYYEGVARGLRDLEPDPERLRWTPPLAIRPAPPRRTVMAEPIRPSSTPGPDKNEPLRIIDAECKLPRDWLAGNDTYRITLQLNRPLSPRERRLVDENATAAPYLEVGQGMTLHIDDTTIDDFKLDAVHHYLDQLNTASDRSREAARLEHERVTRAMDSIRGQLS